jgi:hypothetical protein
VSTRHGHGHILRILEVDAILCRGVPNRILRRKLAFAFDFRWSHVVEVEAPVCDVAVVPDPIEELSAAEVVVPAPVHVNAALNIRNHLRRADPAVVVEPRRGFGRLHFIFRAFEVVMAPGQANLDVLHFADQAVADNFGGFVKIVAGTLP